MSYRVPLSSRSQRSTSVNGPPRVVVTFNRQQPVTQQELHQLKNQRNDLVEEKKLLKSRIARLQAQTRRGKNVSTTPHLMNHLTREYKSLQSMITTQNAEITKLKRSDDAALLHELHEEIKIIWLERKRLQNVQLQQQLELDDSQKELDELVESDGPDTLKMQQKKIAKYERTLRKYKEVNARLAMKIKAMRAERANQEDINQAEIKNRCEELEEQIVKAKTARKNYEEKLKNSQEEHKIIMQKLRDKLGL